MIETKQDKLDKYNIMLYWCNNFKQKKKKLNDANVYGQPEVIMKFGK